MLNLFVQICKAVLVLVERHSWQHLRKFLLHLECSKWFLKLVYWFLLLDHPFHLSLSLNRESSLAPHSIKLHFGAAHNRPTLSLLKTSNGRCLYVSWRKNVIFNVILYKFVLICLLDHNLFIDEIIFKKYNVSICESF